MSRLHMIIVTVVTSLWSVPAFAELQSFEVISDDDQVGTLQAQIEGNTVYILYDVKNNGRGPTIRETLEIGVDQLPNRWTIEGTSAFGAEIQERLLATDRKLNWSDALGTGEAIIDQPTIYVAQSASPWALGMYARALLADPDHTMASAPGGKLSVEERGTIELGGERFRNIDLHGLGMEPATLLLDKEGGLVASYSAGGATIRRDLVEHVDELSVIAAEQSTARFAQLQRKLAHDFTGPVRVRNVRIFNPQTGLLTPPSSVVFFNNTISAIEPLDAPVTPGETVIEGEGGVIIPGLHDMHAHVSLSSALHYIASGVTSVRDMGNDNERLIDIQRKIEAGELAGPRVVRNGFIEGESPFSMQLGFVVKSVNEALEAVRWYAARGYWQVKIYNSMKPEWVPAIVAEAKKLGMGVTGHVPAFSDANSMIDSGYDDIAHINQLMLGWVLEPEEDTRTPLRLTAMRRTAYLELSSPEIAGTLEAMAQSGVALDTTAVTLELLMLGRDGEINPAVKHYYDHLPVTLQRRRKQAITSIDSSQEDAEYHGAFDTIKKLLKDMHDRGITLLPGTDDGMGLSLHRELQIYSEAGIPPADVLRIATLGMERYFGRDQWLGSIEKGKAADFLLLDGNPLEDMTALHRIAMVVKGGTVYFPREIWQEVGVKPFAAPPLVFPAASD